MTIILPLPYDHHDDELDLDVAWDNAVEPDDSVTTVAEVSAAREAKTLEAKATNRTHTGAMVALWIPLDVANAIAVPGGEAPTSMHVTLAYLGQADDVDEDAALEAVRAAALRQVEPLETSFTGAARFGAGDDGVPEVLLVNAVGLGAFRARLVEELELRGIEVSKRYDFLAHTTLRYLDEDDEALEGPPPEVPDDTWLTAEVVLALGDDLTAVPFGGSALDEKALRRVRTPEGARRFGLPIGAVIVADGPARSLGRLLPPAGESAAAKAQVPSVESLIAGGMDPEKAVAEHKRLHHNLTVKLIRARQKQEKAAAAAKAQDAKLEKVEKPKASLPAAIQADLLLKGQMAENPGALYDRFIGQENGQPVAYDGPGAVPFGSLGGWHQAIRQDTDEPIPVVGLTLMGGNYRIERGFAVRRNGRVFLMELNDDEDVNDEGVQAQLESAIMTYDRVMKGVPGTEGRAALMHGVALLKRPNPSDAQWAEKYQTDGFQSRAAGGYGGNYWFNGNLPDPPSIAHEYGHVVDSGTEHAGTGWVSRDPNPYPGTAMTWNQAAPMDRATSLALTRLAGVTWTRPSGHHPMLGESAVTSYGANSPQEDFAESVRLYLKDHREGKLGYVNGLGAAGVIVQSTDAGKKMDVRFADIWPERARILDAIFGHESTYDTPYKQAQLTRARNNGYRRYVETKGEFLESNVGMKESYGLTSAEAYEVRAYIAARYETEQVKAQLEFAGAVQAAFAEWINDSLSEDAEPEDLNALANEHVIGGMLWGSVGGPLEMLLDAGLDPSSTSPEDIDNLTKLFWSAATEKLHDLEDEAAAKAIKKKQAATIEFAAAAKAKLATWLNDVVEEDTSADDIDDLVNEELIGGLLAQDVLLEIFEDDVLEVMTVDEDGSMLASELEDLGTLLKQAGHELKTEMVKAEATKAKLDAEEELQQATADAAVFQASTADYAKLDADTVKKIRKKKSAVKFYAKKGGASPEAAQLAADEYELNAIAEALEALGLEGTQTTLDTTITSGGGVESNDKMQPRIKAGTNGKAKKFLDLAGYVAHPKSKTYQPNSLAHHGTPKLNHGSQRGRAKDYLVMELSDRLNNEADWKLLQRFARAEIPMGGFSGSVNAVHEIADFDTMTEDDRRYLIYDYVNKMISGWASTSGDSNVRALMMQHAVKDEFGLSADWGARFLAQGAQHNQSTQDLLTSVTEHYPIAGPLYRRFVRVMYEHTQEQLAADGVTEVGVHRGMNGMPWEKGTNVRPTLQPANSWSSSKAVAKRFGHKILSATIPASRILGTARTGFGCLNEAEFVILDSDGLAAVSYKYNY